MPTLKSETYNGDTIAMKNYDGRYWVDVNGRKQTMRYDSKQRAEKAYNRLCNKYKGGDDMMGGGRFGEQTVRDALGL
jgi:hypothetical protein